MTNSASREHGERKRGWRILLGLGALLLALFIAIFTQRLAIARSLIASQLSALGLEDVQQEVERVGLREFHGRNLSVGPGPDLSVDEITAHYTLSSLLTGRLAELSLAGVRLRGRLDEAGLSFDALAPVLQNAEGQSADAETGVAPSANSPPQRRAWALPPLPARRIAAEDVIIELETEYGPVRILLDAELQEDFGGQLTARADLEAEHSLLALSADLSAQGSLFKLEGNASFELEAQGVVRSDLDLEAMALAGEARLSLPSRGFELVLQPAAFSLALQRESGSLDLRGETPELSLSGQASPEEDASELRVRTSGGYFAIPDLGVEGRDLHLDLRLEPSSRLSSGSFRLESLADTLPLRRLITLGISGTLDTGDIGQLFDFTAADPERQLVIQVRGHHDPKTSQGTAQLEAQTIHFHPGALQPAALFPQLADQLLEASGSVDVRGDLGWTADGSPSSGLDVALRDFGLSTPQGRFAHLNAAIHIDGPWPLSTPPGQLLSVADMDFGLTLTNGLISFQLHPDGVLDVDSAEWSLAGGTIRTRASFDPRAETQDFVLKVSDLDLGRLLELADLPGLSGSGSLHGSIPIQRRGGELAIHGGVLSASAEGGWIRYRDETGLAASTHAQQGMEVVLAALEDFQYKKLEATLDGDTAGPVAMGIHIAGSNPTYLDGHPIEFNLMIESYFMDFLKNATAVYQIPAEIERRLEEMTNNGSLEACGLRC